MSVRKLSTSSIATGTKTNDMNFRSVGGWGAVPLVGADTRQVISNGVGRAVVATYSGGTTSFYVSSNGTTWTSTSVPIGALGIGWDGTRWWTVAYASATWLQSTDATGTSWTSGSTSGGTGNVSNCVYALNKYIIVDRSNNIGVSNDGKAFTVTANGITSADQRIRFNPASSTLIITNGNGTTGTHLTSTNATSWTSRTSPVSFGAMSVANGLFFGVSASSTNTYYTSSDGVTWTTRATLPSSALWNGFVYANGVYIATAQNTSAYSFDGINWTAKRLDMFTNIGNPPAYVGNYVVQISDSVYPAVYYLNVQG